MVLMGINCIYINTMWITVNFRNKKAKLCFLNAYKFKNSLIVKLWQVLNIVTFSFEIFKKMDSLSLMSYFEKCKCISTWSFSIKQWAILPVVLYKLKKEIVIRSYVSGLLVIKYKIVEVALLMNFCCFEFISYVIFINSKKRFHWYVTMCITCLNSFMLS